MICKSLELIKKNIKFDSPQVIHDSVQFGMLLAVVGGFLDAYTFISRGGVFANAQTGNIVLLGVYASKREWGKALVHVPPILAFIIGVITAESIKNNSTRFFKSYWEQIVLIFEITVLFVIGLLPKTCPDIIVTVSVSFAASVQVSSFRKLVDSPYNTTMSTGNLRSASQAAYLAITQKDHKAGVRAIRYFSIIISFIFGGFLGGLITLNIGAKAIWYAGIILTFAASLVSINKGKRKFKLSA